MFEKEAEEKTLKQGCSNIHYYYGFKDGAEFGYNKAKKEMQELEQQIEKMKLCANCKYCGVSGWCHKLNSYLLDKANQSCGNWEIK